MNESSSQQKDNSPQKDSSQQKDNSQRKNSRPQEKLRILFICTVNQMRSATAEDLYKEDPRLEVESAGTHPAARVVISRKLLEWAQLVLVMENRHLQYIRERFPDVYNTKRILSLDIPDDYDFMQEELIAVLRQRVESVL
jgi:predicted protein tyrosine phosphatase